MKKTIVMMLLVTALFAGQALHKELDFRQNDGTLFKGHLKGDEWFNWVETTEGNVAKYNAQSKNYEYMLLKKENSRASLEFSHVKVRGKEIGGALKGQPLFPGQIKKIPPGALGEIWKEKRRAIHP